MTTTHPGGSMNPALDSRARFEAHRLEKTGRIPKTWGNCELVGCKVWGRLADRYVEGCEQAAWEAWQAAIASMWVPAEERLPEPGKAVLLDCGEKTPIRALWAAKHTVEAGDECPEDWAEYDEATDTYYVPPDWYEWNRHEETHWRVHATARAWCEIPTPQDPPIAALAAKG